MDPLAALALPVRRNIIELLARSGGLSVGDISKQFSITSSAISQHLKVLRETQLVRVERRAQRHVYMMNPESLAQIEAWARDTRQLWEGRLHYLDNLLQAEKRAKERHGNR